MKALLSAFWQREPVIVSLLGSAAVWLAVFSVLAAFGHPLTPSQQTALLGLLAALGGVIGRSQVTPTSGATANDPIAPASSVGAARLGVVILALILGGSAAFVSSGCAVATRSSKAGPASATDQQTINKQLIETVRVLKDAAVGLRAVQKLEIALHDDKRVPDHQHRTIQALILKAAQAGDVAVVGVGDLSKTPETRRELVTVFVNAIKSVVDQGIVTVPDPKVRAYLQAGAGGLDTLLNVASALTAF